MTAPMVHPVPTNSVVAAIEFLERVVARGPQEQVLFNTVRDLRKALATPLKPTANR